MVCSRSSHDRAYRPTTLIEARSKVTTLIYNNIGRKINQIAPLGRVTTWTWDEVGNELTMTDPRGNTVTKGYDANNRLTTETYTGDRTHSYDYDPVGNRTSASGPSPDGTGTGTYVTTYTSRNETLAVAGPNSRTTTYSYTNVVGRRSSLIDQDEGTTLYLYDSSARQNRIVSPQDKTTTFTFDTANRQKTKLLADCTLTTWTYEAAGNTLGIHTTNDGGANTVSRLTYTYDNVNNRLTQVDNDSVVVTWSYDAAYQLETEQANGQYPYNITYTYDPVGNRLTANDSGAVTTSSYDAANQLTTQIDSTGITTFTYDGCGNQTAKESPEGNTYSTYDGANQATEIEPPSGPISFIYNALYQRVQKAVEGAPIIKFIYDLKTLLAETDEDDVTTKSFTSGTAGPGGEFGDLISEYDPVNLEESYPVYDAQWSTRELLDGNCDHVASYRNKAFGLVSQASTQAWCTLSVNQWDNLSTDGWNQLPTCNPTGVFGFGGNSGYYYDQETDLYLMGGGGQGRYYDPAVGRFTTQDPIGVDGDDDNNLYRYVGNNPVNKIDPSGNQEESKAENRAFEIKLEQAFRDIYPESVSLLDLYKLFGGKIVRRPVWSWRASVRWYPQHAVSGRKYDEIVFDDSVEDLEWAAKKLRSRLVWMMNDTRSEMRRMYDISKRGTDIDWEKFMKERLKNGLGTGPFMRQSQVSPFYLEQLNKEFVGPSALTLTSLRLDA